MKSDELKFERLGDANKTYPESTLVIRKQFVDAAIAELKDDNRRLKRALWMARANRAMEKIAWFKLWNASISTMNPEDGARQEYEKWKQALGKFLAKVEKYKCLEKAKEY